MILWREEMSVDNDTIDNDHKYLICMINTFEAAITCNVSTKVLKGHVTELMTYTEEHFVREEKIQEQIQFPYLDFHRKKHQELIQRLKHVREGITDDNKHDVYKKEVPNLITILRDWLIHHILNEDMKMKASMPLPPKINASK